MGSPRSSNPSFSTHRPKQLRPVSHQRRAAILRAVEPISGAVTLERYEPVLDAHGKVVAYNAWVVR